jgi:zinc finger protein
LINISSQGTTRLLLLKIPFFREIILESFECPHCGHKDNSIKSGDQIQEKATRFTLNLDHKDDLERQIVKSDTGKFWVMTLGLETPCRPGQITTVEGILIEILKDLELNQRDRRNQDPEIAAKLQEVIDRLIQMMNGVSFPFQIVLDDPAGNSWIAPAHDDSAQKYYREDYVRTREQNIQLGLITEDDENPETEEAEPDPMADVDILTGQIYAIPATCPACTAPCTVNTQLLNIPHFKEVIIMATVCDKCGYKSNEVKTGGAIPEKGKRITVSVKNTLDLSRDLLKSQTCAIECPELSLNVHPGTMGGRFTTVEGLLTQVRDDLHGKMFGVGNEDLKPGDSMPTEEKRTWEAFFEKLDKALKAEIEFTLILEDPLASSYVQGLGDEKGEGEVDEQLKVEEYLRTEEEEEELGLSDMKTEGYEEGHRIEVEKARVEAEAERVEAEKADEAGAEKAEVKVEEP